MCVTDRTGHESHLENEISVSWKTEEITSEKKNWIFVGVISIQIFYIRVNACVITKKNATLCLDILHLYDR